MNNPIIYKNIGTDKFIASPDIGWDRGESEIIFNRNSVGEIVSLSGVSYRLYIKWGMLIINIDSIPTYDYVNDD